jgi:hypothetical protein
LRKAGRDYQASRNGRFAHAARQQRQREKVTHQSPQEFAARLLYRRLEDARDDLSVLQKLLADQAP